VIPILKLSVFHSCMVLIVLGTLVIVAIGYIFFLAFEKPFLSKKRKENILKTELISIENPAI
jgi:hypothetical protein